MENRQIAEYKMGLKSLNVLTDNVKIWEGDKIFAENVNFLKSLITEIDNIVILQKTPIKGITIEKAKYRKELNDTTFIILGIICVYATKTDNPELYQKFDIPKSSIAKMIDVRFPMLVKDITAYVTANKTTLKPYGLTDDLLKTYQIQTANYNTYLVKPAETIALIAKSTETLKVLIKKLMDTFTKLIDKNMLIYSVSQPFFYGEYQEARYIFDMPTHHFSVKGTVTDADTGEQLYYATVRVKKFKAGTELASKVKSTSKKGNFQFKGLDIGKWTVEVENTYYQPYTTEINLLPDEMYKLDIKLKKI